MPRQDEVERVCAAAPALGVATCLDGALSKGLGAPTSEPGRISRPATET